MKHFYSSLLVLFSFFTLAPCGLAEAKIPIKDRVPNQKPGYCAWASLETVCRHQGIKEGYDLVEKRKLDPDVITWCGEVLPKNLGYEWALEGKLQKLGVKYKINRTGWKNKEGLRLIISGVDSGRGAVVGVLDTPTCKGPHAIVVIDFKKETFEYIDSNTPKVTWVGSVDWFLEKWDGLVLVLEK